MYPSKSTVAAAPRLKQHFRKFYTLLRTFPFCFGRGIISNDLKKMKSSFLDYNGQLEGGKKSFRKAYLTRERKRELRKHLWGFGMGYYYYYYYYCFCHYYSSWFPLLFSFKIEFLRMKVFLSGKRVYFI